MTSSLERFSRLGEQVPIGEPAPVDLPAHPAARADRAQPARGQRGALRRSHRGGAAHAWDDGEARGGGAVPGVAAGGVILEPGLLLAHKPRGETSSSLVQALRARATSEGAGALALCHGGALDPFAEGRLLLLAGPVTRLMEDLHPVPKCYEAELVWGAETDTCDLHGKVVAEGTAPAPGPETSRRLEAALAPFHGWHLQAPDVTRSIARRYPASRTRAPRRSSPHRAQAAEVRAPPQAPHRATGRIRRVSSGSPASPWHEPASRRRSTGQ